MRFNHQDIVLSFEGTPLKEAVDETTVRDVTFRSLVLAALNGVGEGEHLGAEDKARCFDLSTKFFRGKFVKLSLDERAFIKNRAGITLTAVGYGRVSEWLEGQPQATASDIEDDDPSDGEDVDDLAAQERQ